jgi:hypothetical protein
MPPRTQSFFSAGSELSPNANPFNRSAGILPAFLTFSASGPYAVGGGGGGGGGAGGAGEGGELGALALAEQGADLVGVEQAGQAEEVLFFR